MEKRKEYYNGFTIPGDEAFAIKTGLDIIKELPFITLDDFIIEFYKRVCDYEEYDPVTFAVDFARDAFFSANEFAASNGIIPIHLDKPELLNDVECFKDLADDAIYYYRKDLIRKKDAKWGGLYTTVPPGDGNYWKRASDALMSQLLKEMKSNTTLREMTEYVEAVLYQEQEWISYMNGIMNFAAEHMSKFHMEGLYHPFNVATLSIAEIYKLPFDLRKWKDYGLLLSLEQVWPNISDTFWLKIISNKEQAELNQGMYIIRENLIKLIDEVALKKGLIKKKEDDYVHRSHK